MKSSQRDEQSNRHRASIRLNVQNSIRAGSLGLLPLFVCFGRLAGLTGLGLGLPYGYPNPNPNLSLTPTTHHSILRRCQSNKHWQNHERTGRELLSTFTADFTTLVRLHKRAFWKSCYRRLRDLRSNQSQVTFWGEEGQKRHRWSTTETEIKRKKARFDQRTRHRHA